MSSSLLIGTFKQYLVKEGISVNTINILIEEKKLSSIETLKSIDINTLQAWKEQFSIPHYDFIILLKLVQRLAATSKLPFCPQKTLLVNCSLIKYLSEEESNNLTTHYLGPNLLLARFNDKYVAVKSIVYGNDIGLREDLEAALAVAS